MVLRLAEALDIPLRQHNALLLAAGFAPTWRESGLDAPELAQVASAVDRMLAQQEPYPAVAVDRHWRLLKANGGAVRLVEFLVGPIAPGTAINLADALVAPDVLRPLPRQLGRGGALFHPQRGGRCRRRRQRRDGRAARPAAGLQGRAGGPEGSAVGSRRAARCCRCTSAKARRRCRCSRPSPRSARRRTSRAGAAHRELLPDGRRDRQGAARLGCEAERACAGELTSDRLYDTHSRGVGSRPSRTIGKVLATPKEGTLTTRIHTQRKEPRRPRASRIAAGEGEGSALDADPLSGLPREDPAHR